MKENFNNANALKRYNLDTSALFYPIMSTKKAQSLFRLVAVLEDTIDARLLEEAVNVAINRFPTFKVRLKKGYAWHYLEENNEKVKVFEYADKLLRPIGEECNGYLFRLSQQDKMVSLEMFHGLSDATGAILFLKAILFKYRLLQGRDFTDVEGLVDLDTEATEGETEDSFKRYYRPIKLGDVDLKSLTGGAPTLLDGTISKNGYGSDYCSVNFADVKPMLKTMGETFTSFSVGILARAVERCGSSKRPIVLMIPVNLRSFFPSDTQRNFVLFVRLVFKPSECNTLAEYIKSAGEQLRKKASEEELSKMISTTERSARSALLRMTPLFFKTGIAKFIRLFLKARQTLIFSNLGTATIPKELGVERFTFNVNVSKNSKVNVGAITTNGEVTFSFTRSVVESKLYDAFRAELEDNGIHSKQVLV